jgi:lactate permease
LALFLKIWRPRKTWHFADEPVLEHAAQASGDTTAYSHRQIASAWVPWLLLSAFVFAWGTPQIKTLLGTATKSQRDAFSKQAEPVQVHATTILIQVPALHKQIARGKEVANETEPEAAIYEFNWLSTTGTSIFCAAIVSAFWLRVGPIDFIRIFRGTCWSMRWPLFTISSMLAIAYVTRYSGMDATMGLTFTKTGGLFPFFAALLGWLGVALTGSDTSSNALFGSLQKITATQLHAAGVFGAGISEAQAQVLICTANSTGGVMGKMIDAQSIVVAAVATGQHNQEGPILRFVFWHSLALAVLMGLLVLLQAYWGAGMIP